MKKITKLRLAALGLTGVASTAYISASYAVAAGAAAATEIVASVVDVEATGIAVITVLTTAFTFKMIRKML